MTLFFITRSKLYGRTPRPGVVRDFVECHRVITAYAAKPAGVSRPGLLPRGKPKIPCYTTSTVAPRKGLPLRNPKHGCVTQDIRCSRKLPMSAHIGLISDQPASLVESVNPAVNLSNQAMLALCAGLIALSAYFPLTLQ